MRLKKCIAMILSIVMMCTLLPMMPQDAQAANLLSLDPVKAGDEKVTCHFTDIKDGDKYEVYLNGVKVNFGSFDKDDINQKSMFFKFGFDANGAQRKVKAGEVVRVYMSNPNGDLAYKEVIVDDEGGSVPSESKLPTSMTATPEKIKPSPNAQVKLSFDAGYVAHPEDMVRVSYYDSKGAVIDYYDVELPDVYTGPVTISLKDSAKASYYRLNFCPGDGTPSIFAVKVVVDAAGGQPSEGGQDTPDDKEQLANAVGMVFHYPSSAVALGESVTPTIQLTNAQGESKDYNGQVIFSYSGDAVVDGSFDSRGRFTVKSNKKYEGSKIYVSAMIGSFSTTIELTVQASGHKLVLTPSTVGVGGSRALDFQLYNINNEKIKLVWQPTMAKVIFRLPDGVKANTFGNVTKLNSITKDGSGSVLVSSDTVTNAEVYIAFSDNEGHYYETGSAQISFTEANKDERNVEMTIGSCNYTVNGISKTSDTPPIAKDNRTFVPVRMLTEAIGGTVDYEPTTQAVTAKCGDTVVILHLGSKEYTVNGKVMQSDVAPYATNNRTMVPLRIVVEAFDCVVTPHYLPNGTVKVTVEK